MELFDEHGGKIKFPGRYRVQQPIENFKIRVRIAKHLPQQAEVFEQDQEVNEEQLFDSEEREFQWQEKVLNTAEIKLYSEEKNCLTDLQKDYHRRIAVEEIEGSRLYSYVKGDNYTPDHPVIPEAFKSKLAILNERALPATKNLKPFAERYNKTVVDENPSEKRICMNHYLYQEVDTMYIVVDLSLKDGVRKEVLLCTVSYDKTHKNLLVSPNFADEYYTIKDSDTYYNYWIEHASLQPTARELQRRKEIIQQEIQKIQSKKEVYFCPELYLPPPNILRLIVTLEILAAHNFSYEPIYITYFIDLPQNWTHTSNIECLSGRTQRAYAKKGSTHFSYIADIALDFDMAAPTSDKPSKSWPILLLSVASIDCWTRYRLEGYASMPLPSSVGVYDVTLKTWRPLGGFVDTLRRYFTGGSCELEDITYCGIPAMHEGTKLEKTNLKTAPSGSIDLRLNVIQQCHKFIDRGSLETQALERLSAGALLSSVDDVLAQFKAARERMIRARAMCS